MTGPEILRESVYRYARLLIGDARAAKANGRPSVAAFYVKQARRIHRDARRQGA